ncbi:hypothetical protein [Arthrobacter sp. RAF14]|uniref:hypothetical protein n=1 Tax=Arthrobacter sp. RAF14 TaxID=3233051 RepID=UPI003F92473C
MDEILASLPPDADHRLAEHAFTSAGWTPCGAGDWAIALRSPDGSLVARISPFDPTGPYTAALYRAAAHTRQVPRLHDHRRLAGGGDLQVMEWLGPATEDDATEFLRAVAEGAPPVNGLARIVHEVHARAMDDLPWCGPLDRNPANVMRGADGRLVVTDLFYADGPALYAQAESDPGSFVTRMPREERRFMTEIPLAASGPWPEPEREALRAAIAEADRARSLPARRDSPGGRAQPLS